MRIKVHGMVFLLKAMTYLMEKLNIVQLLKLVILIMHLLQLIALNNPYLKRVETPPLMLMLIILIILMARFLSVHKN